MNFHTQKKHSPTNIIFIQLTIEDAGGLWPPPSTPQFQKSPTSTRTKSAIQDFERNLQLVFSRPFHPVVKVIPQKYCCEKNIQNLKLNFQMTTAFEKKFIEVHLRADFSPSSNESDSDSYFSFRKPSMTFASTASTAPPPEGFELKLVNLSYKYMGVQ